VIWGTGFVKLARGELDQAEANVCDALRMKRPFHDTLGFAFALDVLAWTTVAKGECERAAVLLGGASQLWQTFGAQLFGSKELMARREQFEEIARQAIGNAAFDAAFARGGDLTVDETLAFALRERGSTSAAQSRRSATDLTPREREIADLVADGMSNKEIAASLSLLPVPPRATLSTTSPSSASTPELKLPHGSPSNGRRQTSRLGLK
jgi:ATP/maltotriose-dependent transcriptional regulator MalT